MATLLPEAKQSYTNSATGAPLVGGKLYTYDAGTNNPRQTFQDAAGTIPNTNPIILDARGEAQIFWSGSYKIVLKDATDTTIWTVDDVSPTADSVAATLAAIAALGLTGSPIVGGTGINSNLVLRSTSGAGTTNPATTTDTIIFQRGNNGNQELGRFSPGGSFGIGTTTPNYHAGDDGTSTRVCTVLAATAPLFIGATTRNNGEAGGPVGRSVASFEGYRLSNAAGSQESGALRVITEGVSATQLGARVSILTRRDGFSEADFVERWGVMNDGNVYHGGGAAGVGGANRSGHTYGNTVMTISGQTGRAVLELTTNAADADQVVLGDVSCLANFQTDEKRVALIQGFLAGGTATKRGGEFRFYLKADNGTLAERMRLSANGLSTSVPIGTRQVAPALAIAANVIAPVTPIAFVGAGLVKTITPPVDFNGLGGTITIIPTAAFTTDATGNIAIASVAVVGRAMTFTYDGGTAKWYPSY